MHTPSHEVTRRLHQPDLHHLAIKTHSHEPAGDTLSWLKKTVKTKEACLIEMHQTAQTHVYLGADQHQTFGLHFHHEPH